MACIDRVFREIGLTCCRNAALAENPLKTGKKPLERNRSRGDSRQNLCRNRREGSYDRKEREKMRLLMGSTKASAGR